MHTPEVTLRTGSAEQTRTLGAAVAVLLQPGDVVALSGELGAGKTCFVQGAARGLGVAERVTSPTFVLMKTYPNARIPLVHCDVYRLDSLQDVYGLGDDVLAPDVVTFVEWGDAVEAMLPGDRLEVELVRADGVREPHLQGNGDAESERIVRLRPLGSWTRRYAQLAAVCDTRRAPGQPGAPPGDAGC